MKTVLAVDVGYGRVKALSVERQLDFPSVVGPWRNIRYRTDVSSSGYLENLAVEYAGEKLYLGDIVYRQSVAKMDMSQERFLSVEGMALMLTAIAMLFDPRHDVICNLVTGLPVNVFALQKDKYMQALEGWHHIKFLGNGLPDERQIRIVNCKVLPQPVGTVFSAVLDDKGNLFNKELAASRLGILDIGANTVDLCRMDALDFIDRESATFSDLGVFDCYRQLSLEIFNSFGVEIPPEEIEPYAKNNAIKIKGQSQSIVDIKNRAYKKAAEKIVSRSKNVWRNLWQMDKILVAGGGAILFGNYIAQAFNSPGQVEVSDKASFTNVLGYLKYGQRAWTNE